MKTSILLAGYLASVAIACGQPVLIGTTNSPWLSLTNQTQASTVAVQALPDFLGLVTSNNFSEVGFDSFAEIGSATLGEPMAIYQIGLDSLSVYQTNVNAVSLLASGNQFLYPVMVNDQTRSSLLVANVNGAWSKRRFGGAGLISLLTMARTNIAATAHVPQSSLFVVEVPGLNLYFMGRRFADSFLLTTLLDIPEYNMNAGTTGPAEEILGSIIIFAKGRNKGPG